MEIIDSEISDGDEGINVPESANLKLIRTKVHRNKKNTVIRGAKEKSVSDPLYKRWWMLYIGWPLLVGILLWFILPHQNTNTASSGNGGAASVGQQGGQTAAIIENASSINNYGPGGNNKITQPQCDETFTNDDISGGGIGVSYPSSSNPCFNNTSIHDNGINVQQR